MNNILYKMMIVNAAVYVRSEKSKEPDAITIFEISEVLALVLGKLKEDIVSDIIKVELDSESTIKKNATIQKFEESKMLPFNTDFQQLYERPVMAYNVHAEKLIKNALEINDPSMTDFDETKSLNLDISYTLAEVRDANKLDDKEISNIEHDFEITRSNFLVPEHIKAIDKTSELFLSTSENKTNGVTAMFIIPIDNQTIITNYISALTESRPEILIEELTLNNYYKFILNTDKRKYESFGNNNIIRVLFVLGDNQILSNSYVQSIMHRCLVLPTHQLITIPELIQFIDKYNSQQL